MADRRAGVDEKEKILKVLEFLLLHYKFVLRKCGGNRRGECENKMGYGAGKRVFDDVE